MIKHRLRAVAITVLLRAGDYLIATADALSATSENTRVFATSDLPAGYGDDNDHRDPLLGD